MRFVAEPVYGHVGGGEQRVLSNPVVSTCFASIAFACPACGGEVFGGQLLCLRCNAVFLLRGQDRYYSPILNEFVTLVENQPVTRTIEISRKLATRFLLYGPLVHRRSPVMMLQLIFDKCIKQLVRWQSDREWGEQTKIETAKGGMRRYLGAQYPAMGLVAWHAAFD